MSKNKKYFTKGNNIISSMVMFMVIVFFSNLVLANSGKDIFRANCAACHKLTSQKTVGPGLEKINEKRSEEWFIKWVKNSQALIESGDKDAVAVHEANGGMMPPFSTLSDGDIKSIYQFISEQPAKSEGGATTATTNSGETEEPTTPTNPVVFWGVVIIAILLYLLIRAKKKVAGLAENYGGHTQPHYVENYPLFFLLYVCIAAAIIYLLYFTLGNSVAHVKELVFIALPYVALAIFLIGSIYRWTKKGYQTSSLSSQFMEGNNLFWGSQPFHWGLLVLFFGHLIAFLFPSTVLAWNGSPWRLLILEISSFAFALGAFFGLLLLIRRRLTTKKLLVVSNRMDMVVYVVLIVQILSGLGVAFFVRWGSSWFASSLTPYLRSIFVLNPDVSVISAAPFFIQLHVISAFLFIAIIPFTRFMHFLVAPLDYAWRKTQLVYWNWNRATIRNSTSHFFGKKPRNH